MPKINNPFKWALNIVQAIGLFFAAWFFINSFKRSNEKAKLHEDLSHIDHKRDAHQQNALAAKQKARAAALKAELRIQRLDRKGHKKMASVLEQLNEGAEEL